nr:alkaline phosphatase family protein [Frisingicoccus sp.]
MLKKLKIPKIISILFWLMVPPISFWLMESLTHSVLETMEWPLILLNMVFYYLLYSFILIISKRSKVSISLGSLIVLIVGLLNYYVIKFRSVPVYPWDIFSVRTAASVSDNFDYSLDGKTIGLVLGFIVLMAAGLLTDWKLSFKKRRNHLVITVIMALLIVVYGKVIQMPSVHEAVGFYEYLFTPNSFYRKNGFAVSFISNMQYLAVEKPSGYNGGKAEEILEVYDDAKEVQGTKPNIIVIMNEAFSDLSVLGDFETNVDYMPNIRALEENTIKGTTLVSVKGGNTANTEYEFLTGNSMAFLPVGSIPYQQYIRGEMPSIAWQFKNQGYSTYAMHPYGATGWNRNKVYEYFGFEESFFKQSFKDAEVLREYVTDLATYQKIVDIYSSKDAGEPMFVFDVTMQNHSSYSKEYENFKPDVEVYGSENDKLLERYLSLIKVSDAAFGELVNFFSKEDEPTIILMFGDHQPADWVVEPIYKMNGMTDSAEWSESMERYEVPFILWANYDIDEESIKNSLGYEDSVYQMLSVNYMGTLLFEAAGLPLSQYQQFMKEMLTKYPIITANVFCDAQGTSYEDQDVNKRPEEWYNYWNLNYNLLFDEKHRNNELYE